MPVPEAYKEPESAQSEPTLDRSIPQFVATDDDDRSRVPVHGLFQVGMGVGRLIGDFTAPLPWVGPVVELVTTIVDLCQNVGKNR